MRAAREPVISGGRRVFHATGMVTDVSLRLPYLVFDRLLIWLTLLDLAPSSKDRSLFCATRFRVQRRVHNEGRDGVGVIAADRLLTRGFRDLGVVGPCGAGSGWRCWTRQPNAPARPAG